MGQREENEPATGKAGLREQRKKSTLGVGEEELVQRLRGRSLVGSGNRKASVCVSGGKRCGGCEKGGRR